MEKYEAILEVTPLLFVYGTLKKGCGNNRLLSDSEYVGQRVTSDKYCLGDVGFPYAFPAHVFDGYEFEEEFLPVLGDLFKVTNPVVMARVDALEGEGSHYHRKLIETTEGETAWMYHQLNPMSINSCYLCSVTPEGEYEWKSW